MIAQVGGLNYRFPDRQRVGEQQVAAGQAQMAPQQQGGSPFDIPLAESGVPTIENYTRNYYDSYSKLKDFTETMWKDYGVDVTKPDFSQPGGGLLHEAFQKMDADLRIAANDLAESKTILAEQRKAYLEGKAIEAQGYDPYAQIAREVPQGQRMVPLGLAEDVQQAVQGVSNRVYNTPQEAERAYATLQPLRNKYAKLIKDDPENTAFYQRQIDAMREPTYSTPDVAFRPPSSRAGGKENFYLTMAKKIANDWAGNWDKVEGYAYDPQTKQSVSYIVPESGLSLGSTTINGKNAEKIVKRYIKDKDGNVFAEFENPAIPREQLNNRAADEAVTTVMDLNPKLGGAEGIQYMNQFRDQSGRFGIESLYTPAERQALEQSVERGKQTTGETQAAQQTLFEIKKNIESKFEPITSNWMTTRMFGIGTVDLNIKDLLSDYPSVYEKAPDANIEINWTNDKFKFTSKNDYKLLAGLSPGASIKESDYKELSKEQIIDILSNYVSDILNVKTGKTPSQTTPTKPTRNWVVPSDTTKTAQ